MSHTSTIENSHFLFGSILVPNEIRTWLSEHDIARESIQPRLDARYGAENEEPHQSASKAALQSRNVSVKPAPS